MYWNLWTREEQRTQKSANEISAQSETSKNVILGIRKEWKYKEFVEDNITSKTPKISIKWKNDFHPVPGEIRYTYIITYIHTYIRTYIHIYIHTYLRPYIYTYIHTYIHTSAQKFTYGQYGALPWLVYLHLCLLYARTADDTHSTLPLLTLHSACTWTTCTVKTSTQIFTFSSYFHTTLWFRSTSDVLDSSSEGRLFSDLNILSSVHLGTFHTGILK